MLFIDITGGLGNQLFQIFAGISYSYENNLDFFLPLEKKDKGFHKFYWNNIFKELLKYTKNNYYTNKIIRRYYRYMEKSFEYNKIPKSDKIVIHGCFQSEKYFINYYNKIIKLLQIRELQNSVKSKYNNLLNDITISLHFRLGNYKNNKHHPIINDQYYIDSINYILKNFKINNYNILYFYEKEDNELVKIRIEKIKNNFDNINFISINHNIEDWEQILLMSCCKHNIIANSSFSWWGAYLNENKDNIVTYPKIWFSGNNLKHNLKDLFPKKWIKI